MEKRKTMITVIGGSRASKSEIALAEEVGREIARRGAVLVCGGLGGIMEAVCRGAKSAGGLTVGILPGALRNAANPYVKIAVVTGMGEARNVIVVNSADIVIAVGGAYGTLSEIALALRNGTKVIGLGTWALSRGGEPDTSIIQVESAAEAVDLAFDLIE